MDTQRDLQIVDSIDELKQLFKMSKRENCFCYKFWRGDFGTYRALFANKNSWLPEGLISKNDLKRKLTLVINKFK